MGRSPCCDKAKVKKGPWSSEEDAMLKKFVALYGNGGNWISLPKKIGLNRCGKSCRLRWLNYLRPDIRHGDFTEEEDYVILTLYNNIGSRWSIIASYLSGRTDNEVKNYWNTRLKRKVSSGKFNSNYYYNNNNNNNYYYVNTDYSTPINLGDEKIMTSLLDKKHQCYDDQNGVGESNNKITQSYTSSGSVTEEVVTSYTGSSSSMDFNQYSSGSTAISGKNDEFWMDLLSESFDEVVVGSQLEKKMSEIASLLFS